MVDGQCSRTGLLPLLLLGLAKTTPAGHRLQLMETVKDGQLSWFAITLSAATFYELMKNDASPHRVSWCGYGMAGLSFIGMLSGVYAVVAPIQPTPNTYGSSRCPRMAWTLSRVLRVYRVESGRLFDGVRTRVAALAASFML